MLSALTTEKGTWSGEAVPNRRNSVKNRPEFGESNEELTNASVIINEVFLGALSQKCFTLYGGSVHHVLRGDGRVDRLAHCGPTGVDVLSWTFLSRDI